MTEYIVLLVFQMAALAALLLFAALAGVPFNPGIALLWAAGFALATGGIWLNIRVLKQSGRRR